MNTWSNLLRTEISNRAADYAASQVRLHYRSRGGVVLFRPHGDLNRHGNFLDESYEAILGNAAWRERLAKPHPQRRSLPAEARETACELDSCNSSDALLMNVFCYPEVWRPELAELLGVPGPLRYRMEPSSVEFGVAGRVPLASGRADRSELDMVVRYAGSAGSHTVIVEAKLTEKDFTVAPGHVVRSYRDLEEVFDVSQLPAPEDLAEYDPGTGAAGSRPPAFAGYQLIRNVLAAHHLAASFCVICDARRPDLIREWWRVHAAIRHPELRARCGLVLWQEVALVVPQRLAVFLESKYGLVPGGWNMAEAV